MPSSYPECIDDRTYTAAAYLEMEAASEIKHDYLDDRVLKMAAETCDHNSIVFNLIGEFGQALKGSGHRVFASNLRLQDGRETFYTYPDVQIVSGDIEYAHRDRNQTTITNPKVIFEVL